MPEVGSTSRLIMRSSVVLPEPEVPTMTRRCAARSTSETSSTTVVAVIALGDVFDLDHALRAPLRVGQFDHGVEDDGGGEGQRHGRHGAEQHQVHRRLADALEDEDAEAAAADQRGDGGEADVLHQHDADAGEDDRKGQRQFHAEQALPIGHAQRRHGPIQARR